MIMMMMMIRADEITCMKDIKIKQSEDASGIGCKTSPVARKCNSGKYILFQLPG